MKRIEFPDIAGARVLGAVELNKIRFSAKHTVLTPELLEQKSAATESKNGITLA